MGKELLTEFPYSKEVFEEAEDATSVKIRHLCFEGPEDELTLTKNTQPCILTVSIAIWNVLKRETGFKPDFFAGHSLGEYSANVAAEKLSLGEAAMLVRRRGEAMQEAVPAGVGAMAAVLKYPAEDLKKVCAAESSPGRSVEVVNFNSEEQLVIAGHRAAVEAVVKKLSDQQVRCVMLPVSAPFHSKLMEPARLKMTPLLESAKFSNNANKIIANLSGEIATDYNVGYLIKQIDNPVLWTQSMQTAVKAETKTFVEIGPGKVLFGLLRRSLPRGEHKLLTTDPDVKAAIAELK
jgi:[acyl-carrier-protein] S-malonyltransferase